MTSRSVRRGVFYALLKSLNAEFKAIEEACSFLDRIDQVANFLGRGVGPRAVCRLLEAVQRIGCVSDWHLRSTFKFGTDSGCVIVAQASLPRGYPND